MNVPKPYIPTPEERRKIVAEQPPFTAEEANAQARRSKASRQSINGARTTSATA